MSKNNLKRNIRFFLCAAFGMLLWELATDTNLPFVFRKFDIRNNESRISLGIPPLEPGMRINGDDDPGSWSIRKKRAYEFVDDDADENQLGTRHVSKYVWIESNRIHWEKDEYRLRNTNENSIGVQKNPDSVFAITSFRDQSPSELPWRFSLGVDGQDQKIGAGEAIAVMRRWGINLPELIIIAEKKGIALANSHPSAKLVLLDTAIGSNHLGIYIEPGNKLRKNYLLETEMDGLLAGSIELVAKTDFGIQKVWLPPGFQKNLHPMVTDNRSMVAKSRAIVLPAGNQVVLVLGWENGKTGIAALSIDSAGLPNWMEVCSGRAKAPVGTVLILEPGECMYLSEDETMHCPLVGDSLAGKLVPVSFSNQCIERHSAIPRNSLKFPY